jgi:glucose-6-phosphate isomerase
MEHLSIDFSFGGALNGNDNLSRLYEEYSTACKSAAKWLVDTPADEAGHGWLSLPDINTAVIKEAGEWLKGFDSIIHVGIGGSALGSLMLNQALLNDNFNDRTTFPKFYLADNPDPAKAANIWKKAKNDNVALIGVSKSGATAETMSQFLWFRDKMEEQGVDTSKNILVITDPCKGIFREFAKESGCRVLDLPPSVGGRYSVLCAAGLAGAYALGIDIDSLLCGAKDMRTELTSKNDISENPAWVSAALSCFHEKDGKHMSVLMPYSSRLSYFGEWFAQLWGESLGKKGLGMTPVRALGAIDQHSQVQLYTEGPNDKLFTIINVKDHGSEVIIPDVGIGALKQLAYLSGSDIGYMLGLEAMSTASAIVKAGRPVVWIEIGKIDARTLGALIFFYEYMTAMTGRMMGIDPFDQPGVEQGKRYTYGLMGREGYSKDADEAKEWFGRIKEKSIKF